ncbi:MAG: BadF/BadG/BcrA/BcrD ATPase family protein [Sporolactobacillus sp.]
MGYFLAIDGGGTKTEALLFDDCGILLSRACEQGTNVNSGDSAAVTEHFKRLFAALFGAVTVPSVTCCYAGLSGADHSAQKQRIRDMMIEACPVVLHQLRIGGDGLNALFCGTDGAHGLAVIAGTGSMAFGMNEAGHCFRIGGWGYLYGDEGSAFAIGRAAVRRILMAEDSRLPETMLTERIILFFSAAAVSELVPLVYHVPVSRIAALAPLVVQAAEAGDVAASAIVDEAAAALAALIQSGRRRLEQPSPVVLCGGLWRSSLLRERTLSLIGGPAVLFPALPPVYGAAVACVKRACVKPNQDVNLLLGHLKKELSDGRGSDDHAARH